MTKYPSTREERQRAKSRRQRRDKPEHAKAHHAVARALARGDIVKSDECSACGDIEPTVAHHWSYEEEHWLHVVWMCRRCHSLYT